MRKLYYKCKCEYLIPWNGLLESKVSWKLVKDLWHFEKQIELFDAEDVMRCCSVRWAEVHGATSVRSC